jgi:hypothetical protein
VQSHSMSSTSPRIEDSLPVLYAILNETQSLKLLTEEKYMSFFESDLDFTRVNRIHDMLWLCGIPHPARPLHRQKVMRKRVIPIEQVDMHLTKDNDKIFIKPLPAYLLSKSVWDQYLCRNEALHEAACGLLLSYTWLVRSELDFRIAMEEELSLLPKGLHWMEWKRVVGEIVKTIDLESRKHVNKRFWYGELLLSRVHAIYSFDPRFSFRHSVQGYTTYIPFYRRNLAEILTFSLLLTMILSASKLPTSHLLG